ncbi:MAG: hypothetical protein V7760_05365 [Marinobacter sp.]
MSYAVFTPALEWAGKAPEGISKLLVGESQLMQQIDNVTESAERVEQSVGQFSERDDSVASEKPGMVVLQTKSWRGQLMTKARNALAGPAHA